MTHRKAIVLLAIAATLFSTAGLMIKVLTLSPLALVGGRSLIAAILIAVWIRKPRLTWSFAQIGGAVALMLTQVLFVVATRLTTAANAIFLQYTAPVFVALFGIWFLGERARRQDWFAMAGIGAGLYLFFGGSFTQNDLLGDICALVSGVTFAWLLLFLRKQKDGSTAETMLLGNILAALVGLPFLLMETPTTADYLGLLYLGTLQLGIPFILMSIAIKALPAIQAILVQTLEPVLNPVWVFLVIGETPSVREIAGGLVVLIVVALQAAWKDRRAKEMGAAANS